MKLITYKSAFHILHPEEIADALSKRMDLMCDIIRHTQEMKVKEMAEAFGISKKQVKSIRKYDIEENTVETPELERITRLAKEQPDHMKLFNQGKTTKEQQKTNPLGQASKTSRGYGHIEFKDRNNQACSVQCSSAIDIETEGSLDSPGSSCLWLGVDDADPQILASDASKLGIETKATCGWIPFEIPKEVLLSTRMHLNKQQVVDLIEVLQSWVKTGEL